MFIVNNEVDFLQYFRGCYIAKLEGDTFVPYLVEEREHSPDSRFYLTSVYGDTKLISFKDILKDFKLTHPRLGMVSTENSVLYTYIVPTRQYKKGVSSGRLNIRAFHSKELCPEKDALQLFVSNIFNNKYYSLDELLSKFKLGEKVGGAISPRLGLILRKGIKHPLFVYREHIVGSLDDSYNVKLLPSFHLYKNYIERTVNKEVKEWR